LICSAKEKAIKKKLDYHFKYFDFTKISPDPLEFPHRFKDPRDIEISAFIASVFAYGNVKQINNSLEKIHLIMKNKPYEFVKKFKYEFGKDKFQTFKHRFYTPNDVTILFFILNKIYVSYGSLKYFFLLYYFDNDSNLKDAVSFFSHHLVEIASEKGKVSPGLKFMFPDPFKGSACKRMNLFLRWMVRKDELDFGLWPDISTSQLVIPVDTHVARICKQIGLTKRKTVSWLMAEEITQRLKNFDPVDPVKYDFAICHLGIRKINF
jgi:uncharacterized protein (TIGR02757 family)